jgi:hypothetical protein
MPQAKSGASRLYDCCNALGDALEDPMRTRLELGGASRNPDPRPATNLPGVRILS